MLRKLEFGRDLKGLVACTKETRPYFIYHFCAIFCCFLVKCKLFSRSSLSNRISELPDEVLAGIVSDLPLKEAVATSLLSRRWQYVWTSTMNLDFDAGNVLFCLIELKRKLQDHESRRYVHWVNRMVEQHAGPKIKKFRVCHSLNHRFATSINRWVQFAMEKRVEVLELDFIEFKLRNENLYRFPSKLLGLGKEFESLKVLHLESVDVTDQVVDDLLSHCPALERLSISFSNSLPTVRVIGPSIRLKYLELNTCSGLTRVEIRDTNLVSFVSRVLYVDLILSNVPFLVEVSVWGNPLVDPFSMRQGFSQLSPCLSQLQSLRFDIHFVYYNEDDVFPVIENLKNLELIVASDYTYSLSLVSSFLKASPSLERLVLKLSQFSRTEEKKIKQAAKCPHYSLRVVEVVGYRGRRNAEEYVIYLIENVVGLEKIVIDPVLHLSRHRTGAYKTKKQIKDDGKSRMHAMHTLKPKVPSTIEFVCL